MQYLALACALIAGAAGVIAAISTAGWNSAKKDIADLKDQLLKAKVAQRDLSASADAEVIKRELVIEQMKTEITSLETSRAENKDPAAVRARLDKLFTP